MADQLDATPTPEEILRSTLEEIVAASDHEVAMEWSGDPFRRLDGIVHRSASLGLAIRERREYAPARNAKGEHVGWALQRTLLEEA